MKKTLETFLLNTSSVIHSPDLLCSLLQSPPLRTRTFIPTPPWWWRLILYRGSMWSVIDQHRWHHRHWAEVNDTGYFTVGVIIFGRGTTLVVTGKIPSLWFLWLCVSCHIGENMSVIIFPVGCVWPVWVVLEKSVLSEDVLLLCSMFCLYRLEQH